MNETLLIVAASALIGFAVGFVVSRNKRKKQHDGVTALIIPQTYERLQNTLSAGPLTAKDAAMETIQKLQVQR